jgi:hypothetical protein
MTGAPEIGGMPDARGTPEIRGTPEMRGAPLDIVSVIFAPEGCLLA